MPSYLDEDTEKSAEQLLFDLIEEHHPMMLRYAYTLVSQDIHVAQDVVQEAIITINKRFVDFDQAKPFAPWARGIIRYKVLEARRESQKFSALAPIAIDGVDDIYAIIDSSNLSTNWTGRVQSLQHCVQKLKLPMRMVVEHFYSSGYSIREISRAMGLKEDTISKRLSRARILIRDCVKHLTHFEER
ncbi:MAG: sigma-70 family RNA polymerase sigma factor [Opitutales bacterium]